MLALVGFLGFALGFALARVIRFRQKVPDSANNSAEDDLPDPLAWERLKRYCAIS